MTKFLTSVAGLALLSACVGGIAGQILNATDTQKVQAFLQKTATARIAGLQRSYNDFAAATPQFTDGMTCVGTLPDPTKPIDNVGMTNLGTGTLAVWAAVQREVNANAANLGTGTTVEEALAKASIYNPSSAQFNWVVKTIERDCIGYLHDVNQAINATGGMFTAPALTGILAGAPVGL